MSALSIISAIQTRKLAEFKSQTSPIEIERTLNYDSRQVNQQQESLSKQQVAVEFKRSIDQISTTLVQVQEAVKRPKLILTGAYAKFSKQNSTTLPVRSQREESDVTDQALRSVPLIFYSQIPLAPTSSPLIVKALEVTVKTTSTNTTKETELFKSPDDISRSQSRSSFSPSTSFSSASSFSALAPSSSATTISSKPNTPFTSPNLSRLSPETLPTSPAIQINSEIELITIPLPPSPSPSTSALPTTLLSSPILSRRVFPKSTASNNFKPFGSNFITPTEKGKEREEVFNGFFNDVYEYNEVEYEGLNSFRASTGSCRGLLSFTGPSEEELSLENAERLKVEESKTARSLNSTNKPTRLPAFDESVRHFTLVIPIGADEACYTCKRDRRGCVKPSGTLKCKRCHSEAACRKATASDFTRKSTRLIIGPAIDSPSASPILHSTPPDTSKPPLSLITNSISPASAVVPVVPLISDIELAIMAILNPPIILNQKQKRIQISLKPIQNIYNPDEVVVSLAPLSSAITAPSAVHAISSPAVYRITSIPIAALCIPLAKLKISLPSKPISRVVLPPALPPAPTSNPSRRKSSTLPAVILQSSIRQVSPPPILISTTSSGEMYLESDSGAYWCICKKTANGSMIACDSKTCPTVWFHLECTDLKVEPGINDNWFCKDCSKVVR